MSWFVWQAPDGTETVLVDTKYDGDPLPTGGIANCTALQTIEASKATLDTNRGKVFRSYDASDLVFVAAGDVFDTDTNMTRADGILYLKDGTHYLIDTMGFPTQFVDRNGNVVAINNQPDQNTTTITDSVGRTVTINYPALPYGATAPLATLTDTIEYVGTGGNAETIKINYTALQNALSSGEQIQTFACLFPELSGTSGAGPGYAVVISSIALNDGSSYTFQYNAYGEVTVLTLPTGGKYQYQYPEPSFTTCTSGSTYSTQSGAISTSQGAGYTIYRRVLERDEFSDGATLSAKTIFPKPTTSTGPTPVEVDFQECLTSPPSCNPLRSEFHYFSGDPSAIPSVDVNYPAWSDGLEVKSVVQSSPTGSALLTAQKVYQQRACVTGENCTSTSAPRDPQLCQVNTNLDSGGQTGLVFLYSSDLFNNQTDRYEYDYGSAPAITGSCPTPPSTSIRHTATTYQTLMAYTGGYTSSNGYEVGGNGTNGVNLSGLPASRTVYEGFGTGTARSQEIWMYDETELRSAALPSGHDNSDYGTDFRIGRGNVTSHQVWINTNSTYPAESFTYDTTGSVLSHTDFNGNTTSNTFGDSAHVLPTSVARPLGGPTITCNGLAIPWGTSSVNYDQSTLKPLSATDENCVTTNYQYQDMLDRMTQIQRAVGTAIESWTSYAPTQTQVTVKQSQVKNQDWNIQTVNLYDGLGRLKETDQTVPGGTVNTKTTYDGLGRVASITNPGDYSNVTSYTYDALNRVTKITSQDGTYTASAYLGGSNALSITVTDQSSKVRANTIDGLGRLNGVTEDPGDPMTHKNYSTTYTYDVLDNLKTVTQGSQSRSFMYDSLSRLVSASNPETTNTSSNGTTSYGYDKNGNLIWRQDNRGVETCYQYDAVNRIKLQVYFTGTPTGGTTGQCDQIPYTSFYTNTPNVTYTYDSGASNAIGRLVSVGSSATTNSVTAYDALGRVTGSNQTTNGNSYSFGYTYNLADALTTETYPSQRVVTTGYDIANRPSYLTGSLSGPPTPYVSSQASPIQYANHGGVASYAYPNGVARTNTYTNRLQPLEIKDTLTGYAHPALDLLYGYTNTGSVSSLQIQTQTGPGGSQLTFNQSYTYDVVNRLATASDNGGGTGWSENFNYDQYGNMWLTNSGSTGDIPVQTMMPTVQSNYSAATNQLAGITPDPNGNQQSYGGYTIGYDAENRQITATSTSPSLNATYVYDGIGQRVMKVIAGGATTIYVHDAFGNLAAEYTNGTTAAPPCTTCYFSWDHLGTTRMITDASSTIQARHDYLPFGPEIPSGRSGRTSIWGVTDYLNPKFTAQERDVNETGLDFFQARYHGSAQGRFLSPDPAGNFVASVANPQSWNMYSYVLNNPLVFVDPSGLEACPPSGEINGDPCTYTPPTSGGDGGGFDCFFNPGSIFCGGGGPGSGPVFSVTATATPPSTPPSAPKKGIKARVCSVIPSGRTEGFSGGIGGVGSVGGGVELVLNYNSGQTSAFSFGGLQLGWNGGVSGSIYTGFVYGLNTLNANYSGGFTSVNGGAGLGAFAASSSGGLTHGASGLSPTGEVKAVGVGVGAGLLGGFSGGVSATNYTKPLQAGKFAGFTPQDLLLYAARQLCN